MEPKLDHFLTILKNKNFEVPDFLNSEERDLNLREILVFLDKNQVKSTLKRIREYGETEQEVIVENLTLLYPLSQHLMLTIFDEMDKSDAPFIKKFDIESKLCNRMNAVLKDVKGQIGSLTSKGIDYTEKINKLKQDIEKLKTDYSQQKEIDKLEKEKNKWEKDLDEKNLQAKKAGLKKEIDDCKAKIKKIEADNKSLEKQKSAIKKELQELENRLDDSKQKRLLKQFLETCPKDEVDEK